MSAPKILSSIVAAAAIVGSVGYVYAQTQSSSPPATTETPAATPADSSTAPPAASDTTTPTTPGTSTDMSNSTSPSTDTTMTPPAEPKAKADRN